MAKVYTYIPPKSIETKIDTSNLASKEELRDGIQEAKNYTNEEIKKLIAVQTTLMLTSLY